MKTKIISVILLIAFLLLLSVFVIFIIHKVKMEIGYKSGKGKIVSQVGKL